MSILTKLDRHRYNDLWFSILRDRDSRADLERLLEDTRQQERELCAQECDRRADSGPETADYDSGWVRCASVCADAIRNRKT